MLSRTIARMGQELGSSYLEIILRNNIYIRAFSFVDIRQRNERRSVFYHFFKDRSMTLCFIKSMKSKANRVNRIDKFQMF